MVNKTIFWSFGCSQHSGAIFQTFCFKSRPNLFSSFVFEFWTLHTCFIFQLRQLVVWLTSQSLMMNVNIKCLKTFTKLFLCARWSDVTATWTTASSVTSACLARATTSWPSGPGSSAPTQAWTRLFSSPEDTVINSCSCWFRFCCFENAFFCDCC